MSTISQSFSRVLRRRSGSTAPVRPAPVPAPDELAGGMPRFDIAPDDPLIAFFSASAGAVDVDALELDSPALDELRSAGVKLVVPLVTQGELVGLLNLGPRLSEREYSGDDRKLLNDLAAHAAPAVRVAQLVREQEAEVRERERVRQELRVAQLIQQQFLPKQLPQPPGWHIAAYYQPAREVGGDFYDFIDLPGGRIGVVVGDVTDKGVPAALVMATTHSILRSDAPRLVSPGEVLARANELLVAEMPPHMFVTCLYAVLEPRSGSLRYANAGHNVPYIRVGDRVEELRARGMPLGLLEGMVYEERETTLEPGASVLLHSDGLAEAHNPERDMFGFPRLQRLVGEHVGGQVLIDGLLDELARFTGPGWEQEDDITLVTVQRSGAEHDTGSAHGPPGERVLAAFEIRSEAGNEREVMRRVVEAVAGLGLPPARLERLRTAVSEAAMNAIEHGNRNEPDLPVGVRVALAGTRLAVRITDSGGGPGPDETAEPDLAAKLAGDQTPRGWGLFLIRNMVDELHTSGDGRHHVVELVLDTNGADDAGHAL